MIKKLTMIILLLGPFLWLVSQDVEGSKDPPLLKRPAGFYIYDYSVNNFGAYRFCDENGDNLVLEGMITYYYYECDGEIDPQKIIDKFSKAIIDAGGKVYGDDPNHKYLKLHKDNKVIWIDLYAEDFYYTLNIIEKGEKISDISSDDILSDLNEKGEVVLYFNFDRDDCVIKEECKPIIEMIAKVMESDQSLNIQIMAYTDNIGRADNNMLLSESRAKALATKIVEFGINENRLTWEGHGKDNPIADNQTIEGRTLNNRIVLVKK